MLLGRQSPHSVEEGMSELMMWRKRWQAKIAQSFRDPHYAAVSTTSGLKPQNINTSIVGEHISVVFSPGSQVRHYAFEGQANRDRFVNLYRQFGVKPCGDPLKGTVNAAN
jgi:hypothetical protein